MSSLLSEVLEQQRRAAEQGFDWPSEAPLWDKLQEEISELQADSADPDRARHELGDLLFMVLNIARHLRVDPEQALVEASARFSRRFDHVMAEPEQLPPPGDPKRLAAMEARWQAAKRRE